MTHKDIYTKFMIEYDKANVTSSYPSLTEYEVATVLDKAYHALIAQKVTGNNVRRVALEQDLKSIEDISPLIKNTPVSDPNRITIENSIAKNVESIKLEDDHLYFLNCYLKYTVTGTPMDGQADRMVPVQLGSHQIASKFYSTAYNMPWIKTPLGYIEDNKLFIVYDPIDKPKMTDNKFDAPQLVYIKTPNKFVKDIEKFVIPSGKHVSYFDYDIDDNEPIASNTLSIRQRLESLTADDYLSFVALIFPNIETTQFIRKVTVTQATENTPAEYGYEVENSIVYDDSIPNAYWFDNNTTLVEETSTNLNGIVGFIDSGSYTRVEESNITFKERYSFECNDTMAEELISLAVAFALENVESQRLNSKLNMRGLEA